MTICTGPHALVRSFIILGLTGLTLSVAIAPARAGGNGLRADAVPAGQEQSRVLGKPFLTQQQKAALAKKDKAITRLRATAGEEPAKVTHKSLKLVRQHAQTTSYWCGPATLVSLVQANKVDISQSTAARKLNATSHGTDWYQGSGRYPMERALDSLTPGDFDYSAVNLPDGPSKASKKKYQQRLVADISTYGQGIAGNAVEVTNGPHLNGHPNRTIYHWVAVRGYDDGGATTRYADSVAGSNISWAAPVPRYNEIDSNTIVRIFGARGYVW